MRSLEKVSSSQAAKNLVDPGHNWGQSKISFITARSGKMTVLNFDLTPLLAVSGVCAWPAVEAPPEQCEACGQREARSSSFSLQLFERIAQRVASSAVRPQALRCVGEPPQAAGDVGRPGAHTAHRRLQKQE
jgi:hypothetical protein